MHNPLFSSYYCTGDGADPITCVKMSAEYPKR